MAMKTATPWWFSALFAAGLVFVFLGERPFGHLDALRAIFTGLGTLVVLATTGARAWAMSATRGTRREVERTLLLCQAGALGALLLYTLTTGWGQGLLGVDAMEPASRARFVVPVTVLWSIVMAISLVPMLMVELSLGMARRTSFSPASMAASHGDDEAVESLRVRAMGSSGLSVALAAAFLMVTCNVAKERNIRRDVSYFKTSSPGSATVNVVKSVSEPITVYLFFPKVNTVKNEIRGYFESLQAMTGNIQIEEHDRMLSPALAKEYRVNEDGVVVLVLGDKHESLRFTVDPEKARRFTARTELRELDGKINGALMKVVRVRRTVYLTVGHGELSDPDSVWARTGMRANELKRRLREMNYQVQDLGLSDGLANEVPDDADLVMILGPHQDLLDEELAAIDRYLGRGGRLLIALDPVSPVSLGSLEQRLGIRFNPTPITDDQQFMAQTRTPRDHRLAITDRFSSHASITTLSRAPARYGIVFIEAGHLEEIDFAEDKPKAKRTQVIRSMPTAFADENDNFLFDEGTETRQQYNLVAAIEDPTSTPADSADHEGMRAMVFSDTHVFTDLILLQLGGAQAMLDDAVKWLGGEEHFAGEVQTEKDIAIQHTRNEDVLWFYLTIMGAPLVVLGFGLWFSARRRHRTRRTS